MIGCDSVAKGGLFFIFITAVITAANQQGIKLVDGICLLFITVNLVVVGFHDGVLDALADDGIKILLGGLKIFAKTDELGLSFSHTVEPLMSHFLLPRLRYCGFENVHDFVIDKLFLRSPIIPRRELSWGLSLSKGMLGSSSQGKFLWGLSPAISLEKVTISC
eukprot:15365897-Ditylum_brightwellii.AAC.1